MSYAPDWDRDLRVGEAAERLVFDLITGDQIEVKHDRIARRSGRVYVETHCQRSDGWHESGINTTKATVWFFVLDPRQKLSISVSTAALREHVQRFGANVLNERDGSHPTRGVGVPLAALTKELAREQN